MQRSDFPLAYGRCSLIFNAPIDADVIAPVFLPKAHAPEQLFLTAVNNPIGSCNLYEMLKTAKRITVAVSDATRKTGFRHFSKQLLAIIKEHAPTCVLQTIVACGTHRAPTAVEYDDILGDSWPQENRLYNDADKNDDFRYLGETQRGTPVCISGYAVEADLLIVVGEAKFHYFAGYGGGRKSILPGLANRETIRHNRRFSMLESDSGSLLDGPCRMAHTRGNPISEDMDDAVRLFKSPIFMINSIVDAYGYPEAVFAGDIFEAFEAACMEVRRRLEVPISKRYDVVIASAGGWPSDINPIQTHKSFDFAYRALIQGGLLVLMAEISEKTGFDTLRRWLDYPTFEAHKAALISDFDIYGRTALAWREKTEKCEACLVSSLSDNETSILRMTKITDFCKWNEMTEFKGRSVAVMPRASATLPLIRF